MKKITIGNSVEGASQIVLGCMRISSLEDSKIEQHIHTAIECGINMFDHADIYGGGESEKKFAKAIKSMGIKREDMILQSKCGIGKGFFDNSAEYMNNAVDGILSRLKTDYLDILLIHRPDALIEPEDVAEFFAKLYYSGKVKHFGVSNFNSMQIELLQKYLDNKIIANQIQLSITNSAIIDSGIYVNIQAEDKSIDHDGHILDYCRLHDITIQAWSPFQYGFFDGVFLDNSKFPELNEKIDEIADIYGVTNSAIAIAWILKHPAGIQSILGTTNPERLRNICKASDIELTRKQWYEIYLANGKVLP